MPGRLQIAQQWQLPLPLLHTVLAKVPQPGLIRVANRFGWMRLRNADQQDVFGLSAGPQRCAHDLFLHARQILPNVRISGHKHPQKILTPRTPSTRTTVPLQPNVSPIAAIYDRGYTVSHWCPALTMLWRHDHTRITDRR